MVEILLVEDDESGVKLIVKVLEEANIRNKLHMQKMEKKHVFSHGEGKFSGSPHLNLKVGV